MKKMKTLFTYAFLMVISCAFFISAQQFVLVDSIVGKAEIQKMEEGTWSLLIKGTKLYNNDVVRVLDSSLLQLKWPNQSIMYVHQQSQIRINLFNNKQVNVIAKHVTVFFGAIFFVVKKTLPELPLASQETKVYSPTAVVAVRGTSFSVTVAKANGTTNIKVLNGTVLVRNIMKNVQTFLGAGYQTTVELNTDPIVPNALLLDDLEWLRSWVPPSLINAQIAEQIEQAKRDHSIITQNLEDKIIIVPFANISEYKGPWTIGKSLADMVVRQIAQTTSNANAVVVEIPDSSLFTRAMQERARFVITGVIDRFDLSQRLDVSPGADSYKEYYIASIKVRIQLIDVAERKMVLENEVTGEMTGKNVAKNSWQSLNKLPFTLENEKFSTTIIGEAVKQVVEQCSESATKLMRE